MAQPGNFTPILLYASSTPTNVPSAGNLTNSATGSEIAINIADKNLFFKDSGNVVNTVPIRQSSTSSDGWLSATDWNTFNNKAPATSGTSLLYGNGSGGFSNVTIGSGVSFAGGVLSATGAGGTVTSVSGTGTVNGLTLTGTVTTSGSLTLGGTLNLSSPPVIGNTTPAAITGTTITANTQFVSENYYAQSILGGNLRTSGGTSLLNWDGGGSGNVTVNGGLLANPANKNVSLAPTGTGSVTINPATAGTINNMVIGGTTPLAITGTTITATTFSGSGASLTSIPNSALTNSTISGVALGGNLFSLTAGTGVSFSAGTTYNGSAAITINATGTGGTVTSVAALTLGTTGTDLSSTVANGTTTPVITLNVPTASATNRGALSAADWTTFNNKQPAGSYLTAVSVVSANGFAGTSSGGTTPALTLSTSITGLLKGNGAAISAATSGTDYAPATSGTSILYGNGSGGFSNVTIGTGLTFIGGTLASTASGGTVTSVAATVPSFLSISGSPITTSGTLAITLSGTALPTTSGGTGLTSFTSGGVVYASSTSALATSSSLIFNGTNALGIGVTPSSWGSSFSVLELNTGTSGAFISNLSNNGFLALTTNAYQNGSGYLYKYSSNAALYYQQGSHYWQTAPIGTAGGACTFTTQMQLDNGGGLRINAAGIVYGAGEYLSVNSASSAYGVGFIGNNSSGTVNIWNKGTSNPVFVNFAQGGSGLPCGSISFNGTITVYATTSDQRLKTDLGVATDTSVIDNTVIHDFTWANGLADRGVFAQEAHKVKPNAVQVGDDELSKDGDLMKPWGVDYSAYVPDLIVYCQQLKAMLLEQNNEILALKALVSNIKN